MLWHVSLFDPVEFDDQSSAIRAFPLSNYRVPCTVFRQFAPLISLTLLPTLVNWAIMAVNPLRSIHARLVCETCKTRRFVQLCHRHWLDLPIALRLAAGPLIRIARDHNSPLGFSLSREPIPEANRRSGWRPISRLVVDWSEHNPQPTMHNPEVTST